jgi:hypothetical protein
MEHAARNTFDSEIPWRTIALAAGAFALVELVVLLALGIAALGRGASTPAVHRPAARAVHRRPSAPPPHRILTRAQTSVLVLNGNGISGAAAGEAQRVTSAGYRIRGVGNAKTLAGGPTVVMYRGVFRPEAQRLARDLGIRVVEPLDGLLPSGLHGAQLVIVVGR